MRRPGDDLVRLAAAQAPTAIFVASVDGSYEYVNDLWCALSRLEPHEALGKGWKVAVHPDDLERVVAVFAPGGSDAGEAVHTLRFRLPDGAVRSIESRVSRLRGDDGQVLGWVGTCRESPPEADGQTAIVHGERFRLVFDHAPIGTCLVDPDGNILQVNAAFCRLVGYPAGELLTLNVADLSLPGDAPLALDGSDQSRGECRYRRADGTIVWVAASTSVVPGQDGQPLYHVIQAEDIGDRKQAERELRQLADHDALTGLLNRRGFMDGLHRELRRMDRRGEYGALLLLDLDNFKLVNDTAGHMAGDQVLRTTAEVLRRRLRATDVIGRLGGDEFAALVLNVTPRQAREIADETAEALRALTVTAGDRTINVAASIGIVAIDEMRTENEDDLLAAADRAMYRAKSTRRHG